MGFTRIYQMLLIILLTKNNTLEGKFLFNKEPSNNRERQSPHILEKVSERRTQRRTQRARRIKRKNIKTRGRRNKLQCMWKKKIMRMINFSQKTNKQRGRSSIANSNKMIQTDQLIFFNFQYDCHQIFNEAQTIIIKVQFDGNRFRYSIHWIQFYDLHYSPCYSPHDSTLYKRIIQIINKEKIGGILIGKPSFQKGYIDEFTQGLESNLIGVGLQTFITQVGEDYTTSKAKKISKTNNKFLHDGMAAMLILQQFLNEL